jgi:hypothetical protein
MLLPQCSERAVEVEALKLERPIPLDEQQAETARKRRLRTEETAANFEANVCKGAVVVPPTRIAANPAQLPDIDERLTTSAIGIANTRGSEISNKGSEGPGQPSHLVKRRPVSSKPRRR